MPCDMWTIFLLFLYLQLNDLTDHIDERKEVEPKINAINERFNSLREILDKVYLQKGIFIQKWLEVTGI